ncbi:MAG: OmpP1/FadL family transporter [Bacillota bacterium]
MTSGIRKSFSFIIVGLFLSASIPVFGQNANDALRLSEPGLGSNARALGMGNAYTGLSDDFSASSFNPAGFGLLKKMEFAGGLNYSKFNNSTLFFGNTTDYSNSDTKLDQISFAFPFPTMRGSLVFAVGYNRDKDFNGAVKFNGFNNTNTSMIQSLQGKGDLPYELYLTDSAGNTNINGQLNQDGTTLSSGSIGRWAFSGAVELARNVFIGGTINVISGTYKRTRDYYEEDIRGIYRNVQTDPAQTFTRGFGLFYFNDILDWDISGWDANIGVMFQSRQSTKYAFRLGANIQFPTSYTVKEKYTVTGRSEFRTGETRELNDPFVSEVEYDVSTPYVFSGGASFGYKGLILSGSLSFIDYTQMEFTSGLSASAMSNNNRDIKENFRSTLNYNLGAEYTIPEVDLRVRGGFMLRPSQYKADENTTAYDKKYVTGGIGFLADEAFAFDVAYAYGWWKDIGDNYGSNVSRTDQKVNTNNLIFTVTYRF